MINIAVIGTGSIASSHIEGYLEFPEMCKIVALVDIFPEKAVKTKKKFHLDAEVLSDYRKLLDRPDLHAVSVCTPPYTHASISVDVLKAGKHVLVEKPMASSLRECDEMLEAAAKSDKILSVVAQNRFRTPIMKLKQVLDTGLIGKIVHAQVDSFWWRGHSYYDLWWRGTWEKEGGGCTLNHAVHHIDMIQWMMGMPSEVSAMMSNTLHDNAEVEDLSVAIMRYANGSLSQITSSVVHHGEEQQLVFQGEKARVSVPWKVRAEKARENGFPQRERNQELEQEIQEFYEKLPQVKYEGHIGQIHDFLTAIAEKKQVLIDGNEGRKTLELIAAIYKSASIGENVRLPLQPDDPFYTREGILENATYFYKKKTSIENFSDDTIDTGGNYE